uniref:MATH domain-containing protein n=1 Tax=Meloidogyne incognita TaxID=6306 RepID=A0A914MVF0_MELIC
MEVDSVTDEVLSARTNDPYKSEGQIILKIEKFSEFAREKPGNRRLSDPVYIRGLPWNILAIAREMSSRSAGRRCLGYFLQCNLGDEDPSWSCSAKVALKILAQKPQEENHVRKVTHVFHAKENDWGYAQFMTFENIMDPEEGWYDEKEDTIILLVYVKADPPLGVKIDEERLKSLQGIKEKENEIEINNSDGNLIKIKEELENLKKSKEKCEKQLIEKLKENKEIYERLAQNANQLALINEENIKLKEENERLKNFNEYEEEIKKIKSKVEDLEKEKRCALDFIKIKEKELEAEKKKVEELTILNKNLESKVNEA